jgi:hypothetical protein
MDVSQVITTVWHHEGLDRAARTLGRFVLARIRTTGLRPTVRSSAPECVDRQEEPLSQSWGRHRRLRLRPRHRFHRIGVDCCPSLLDHRHLPWKPNSYSFPACGAMEMFIFCSRSVEYVDILCCAVRALRVHSLRACLNVARLIGRQWVQRCPDGCHTAPVLVLFCVYRLR